LFEWQLYRLRRISMMTREQIVSLPEIIMAFH
jgi:hypothetical protein